MIAISDEEFRNMVADAIASLPDEWAWRLEDGNIAVLVEDEPRDVGVPVREGHDVIGACRRGNNFPTLIYIFRGPTMRAESTLDGVRFRIRCVLEHELGHAFGMTEAQIATAHYRMPA